MARFHATPTRLSQTYFNLMNLPLCLRRGRILSSAFGFLLVLCVCNFAPKYQRPQAETPAAFKELTATNTYTNAIGKVAQPSDSVIRGKWWEIFNDPQLNALEEQVAVSNQNVATAFANFLSARAIVRESRAQLYPTLGLNPSVTRSRQPI